ncbi:hypothetical protein RhiJN_06560 [Ceratobasidium sp. AG-Ba]|nr:hypothetical protein RhiJN_06560 [Ceratobasidium sp. AG-Ba]
MDATEASCLRLRIKDKMWYTSYAIRDRARLKTTNTQSPIPDSDQRSERVREPTPTVTENCEVGPDDFDSETSLDETSQSTSRLPDHSDDPSHCETHCKLDDGTRTALQDLIDMGEKSWAQLEDKDIAQRQKQIVPILNSIHKAIAHATGTEMHTIAIWHNGNDVNTYSTSTERSGGFTKSAAALKARSMFIEHVHDNLGSALANATSHAHPTVCGDPEHYMRPLLPPPSSDWLVERKILKLFFEYLWLWQGGVLPVPWSRLELDGKSHFLIEKQRLPRTIICLRCPDDWSERETEAWSAALRDRDTPDGSRFQFRQPRPNVIEHETRKIIHPNSSLVYPPDALSYARRVMKERAQLLVERRGLPSIPTHPYIPLVDKELKQAKSAAFGNKLLVDLLNYLEDYEKHGPYQASPLPPTKRSAQCCLAIHQATVNDWETIADMCPHFNPELPAPSAGSEHISSVRDHHGRQLRREFFDDKPEYDRWRLNTCLELIQGGAFRHTPTGTYKGGPYGFKWAVLLLVHLYSCSVKITNGYGPAYQGVRVKWSRKNTEDLEKAIHQARNILDQSVSDLHGKFSSREQDPGAANKARLGSARKWTPGDVIDYAASPESDEWTVS